MQQPQPREACPREPRCHGAAWLTPPEHLPPGSGCQTTEQEGQGPKGREGNRWDSRGGRVSGEAGARAHRGGSGGRGGSPRLQAHLDPLLAWLQPPPPTPAPSSRHADGGRRPLPRPTTNAMLQVYHGSCYCNFPTLTLSVCLLALHSARDIAETQ